jgi:hypothetical protein
MKLIGIIIGIFCIGYGLYSFSFSDTNQACISTILILTGIDSLLSIASFEGLEKIRKILKWTTSIIALILLIKVFILD